MKNLTHTQIAEAVRRIRLDYDFYSFDEIRIELEAELDRELTDAEFNSLNLIVQAGQRHG